MQNNKKLFKMQIKNLKEIFFIFKKNDFYLFYNFFFDK